MASLAALALAMVGCDDGSAQRILMRKACLQHIYEGYIAAVQKQQTGPADIDSFASFVDELATGDAAQKPLMIGDQVVADEALARLREGEIVVIWGGKIPVDPTEQAECLLAFEARTPGSGGYIALADGMVEHVTAKEFAEYRELPHSSD